jgi:hypothetical protein
MVNGIEVTLPTRTTYEAGAVWVPLGVIDPLAATLDAASANGYNVTGMRPTPSPLAGKSCIATKCSGDPKPYAAATANALVNCALTAEYVDADAPCPTTANRWASAVKRLPRELLNCEDMPTALATDDASTAVDMLMGTTLSI